MTLCNNYKQGTEHIHSCEFLIRLRDIIVLGNYVIGKLPRGNDISYVSGKIVPATTSSILLIYLSSDMFGI